MTACPSDDVLRAFLAEQLSPDEQAAVADHVSECHRCQQCLEHWLRAASFTVHPPAVLELPEEYRPDPAFVQFVMDHPPYVGAALSDVSSNNETLDPAGDGVPEAWPVVPGYEVLAELGRGGMALVYQARQQSLRRLVALKVVHRRRCGDAEWLRRFRTEAEAIARLQHPHIVQIHDILERDAHPVLVLEFCAGGSLTQRLAGGPLSIREAAALACQLARAMHHAHEHGILHCDLKPSNVLFTPDGSPRITDFGLAQLLDAETGPTPDHLVAGTPSYMAPEQLRAGTDAADPRVDVYGLGAVLYEMLAGRPPFQAGTPAATAMQVLGQSPVPPSHWQPGVAKGLEAICLRCLEKDLRRRYATAQALADDLAAWLDGRPKAQRPPSARARNWGVWLAACGLLLVLASSGWWAFSPHGREQSPPMRNDAPPIVAASQTIANAHRGNVYALALSRDGTRLLSGGWDMQLRLWDAASLQPLRSFTGHTNNVNSVAFSPNGMLVLSCCGGPGDNHADLWDATSGEHLRRFEGHTDRVESVAFSPDGEHILTGSWDKTLRLWQVATGREVRCFRGHTAGVNAVRFSPDGHRALSASGDRSVQLWDIATGQERRRFAGHTHFVWGVAISPDGRKVASAGWDRRIFVWDLASGQELLCIEGHQDEVNSVSFSPDGLRLLSASKDRTVRLWDTQTGRELARMVGHRSNVHCAIFTLDGRSALSGSHDGCIYWWRLPESLHPPAD